MESKDIWSAVIGGFIGAITEMAAYALKERIKKLLGERDGKPKKF